LLYLPIDRSTLTPQITLDISVVKIYLSIERGGAAVKETAERLMDLAEVHLRNAGYAGFSFRDIAAEIGLKSASVHHHFPTKATMAAAVARRYADRFFAAVARRPNETADDAIAAYRSTFKAALDRDGLMCLFGVLGAEAGGLSPEIANEILSFFRRCARQSDCGLLHRSAASPHMGLPGGEAF
jgi:AcrR family transcriptional regulator